jgi:hypothetical protein
MADDSIARGGADEAADDESAFDMANLSPALTGLPMVVWVSERGGARHDVRVRVSTIHGRTVSPGQWAVVAVRPAPRLVHGSLSPADFAAVSNWIRLNEVAIVDYWNYQLLTDELIRRLQRLP